MNLTVSLSVGGPYSRIPDSCLADERRIHRILFLLRVGFPVHIH